MVKSSTEVEVFSLTMFAESGPVDFACEIEGSVESEGINGMKWEPVGNRMFPRADAAEF